MDAELVESEVRAAVRGPAAAAIAPTAALRHGLARLFEYTADCQEVPCRALAFTLTRAQDGWRYDLQFGY